MWQGYQRFCSLARALDLIGDRWTWLIIQELSFQNRRYNDLRRQLAGIGTNVLAKRLVENNIFTKSIQGSQNVVYALGPRGKDLLAELRRWGTNEQLQMTDHAPEVLVNDMS